MDDKLHTKSERALEMAKHAEVQAFLYVLLLMKLIDDGDLKNVSTTLICFPTETMHFSSRFQ